MGACKSFLKAPKTNELATPDGKGRFNHFEGGSIYWHPNTGAHEIHGAIKKKWAELGYEKSFLGYPTTDERKTPDGRGRYNHFQGGSIYWHPSTGAHEVHGAIKQLWASLGYERSFLGYPTSDEKRNSMGYRYSKFQGGWAIYWSKNTGANVVHEEQNALENESTNKGAYTYLKKTLKRIRTEYNVPALSATVVASGKVLAYAAVGKRKMGNSKNVTDHDLFAIGSVTKTFTGVLAGKLIQDHPGKLSWSTPMRKLFPELKGGNYDLYGSTSLSRVSRMNADLSTMCLSHISCSKIGYDFKGGFDACCQTVGVVQESCSKSNIFNFRKCGRDEFVAKILSQPKMTSPYNNNAPVVVSAMIQRAFKRNYENLMSEKILFPLGVHARFMSQVSAEEARKLKIPFGHDTNNRPIDHYGTDNMVYHIGHASGGLMMSPKSMGLYLVEMLQNSKHSKGLFETTTYNDMLQHAGSNERTNSGWYKLKLKDKVGGPNWITNDNAYWHNGGLLGFASDFMFVPQENFGYACVSTGGGAPLGDLKVQLVLMAYQQRILSYFNYPQLSASNNIQQPLFDNDLQTVWRAPKTNHTLIINVPSHAQRLTNLALAYPKNGHNIKTLKIYALQNGRYQLVKTINPSRPNNTSISFASGFKTNKLKFEFENVDGKRTRITELLVKYTGNLVK